LSTTFYTGISLHMQWPLTSQSHIDSWLRNWFFTISYHPNPGGNRSRDPLLSRNF
jgi:hypothetical protein